MVLSALFHKVTWAQAVHQLRVDTQVLGNPRDHRQQQFLLHQSSSPGSGASSTFRAMRPREVVLGRLLLGIPLPAHQLARAVRGAEPQLQRASGEVRRTTGVTMFITSAARPRVLPSLVSNLNLCAPQ